MKRRSILSIVRLVGGVILLTLIGIGLGAPFADWLDAPLPFHLPFDLRWLGGAIILGAIGLIIGAEFSFVRFGGGTGTPNDPPNRLVVSGVYRWVRNPLYLSGNALLWGTAFVHNSMGMLVLAWIIAIGFHIFVVQCEEPQLEQRYGDAYREYQLRVPRWLPRLPKSM